MTFGETSFDWHDSSQKTAMLLAGAPMQLAQWQLDSHHTHL